MVFRFNQFSVTSLGVGLGLTLLTIVQFAPSDFLRSRVFALSASIITAIWAAMFIILALKAGDNPNKGRSRNPDAE